MTGLDAALHRRSGLKEFPPDDHATPQLFYEQFNKEYVTQGI
jgi:hypothetical protein